MDTRLSIYKALLSMLFAGWGRLSVEERRRRQRFYDHFSPNNSDFMEIVIGSRCVPALHILPDKPSTAKLLYLHGGAYVLGMTTNHINLCGEIANRTDCDVFIPKYHLAPEDPFPAALHDVTDAYQAILTGNTENLRIIIVGDSAGGGLVLALIQKINKQKLQKPACVFLLSPWTDLTLSSRTVQANRKKDPVLTPQGLKEDARRYAGHHSLQNPFVSPIFSSLKDSPPMLIHVGSEEILLEDSISVAEKIRISGGRICLKVWQNMFHVFQMFPMLPQADEAINEIANFMTQQY